MGDLLLGSYPIVVTPELAGLLTDIDEKKRPRISEAAVLQQINYWISKKPKDKYHDGRYWVYNTYEGWMKQFTWIKTVATMKKQLDWLESKGLVVTGNYNKVKFDRTKWYSIDKERLKALNDAFDRNYQMEMSDSIKSKCETLSNPNDRNYHDDTKDYTKTTTKITKEDTSSKLDEPNSKAFQLKEDFDKLWKLYPNKKGKATAFNAYKRAMKKGVTNKEIQDGIVAYKQNVRWQREHGFKDLEFAHGATWFNQQRWDDDYSLESKATYSYQQVDPYSQYT